MKKILHLAAFTAISFFTIETKAQLADGSTAPNFTFTDMNGNSQDLYTYLNAGKVVVIDVSATWCNPCWQYHNSGNLENFYNQYGPPGTNVAMVLFIEGDNATTNADMNGTGSNTQGCWTCNTPYPMCNPTSVTTFNSNYQIGYFPTMYMICPDKKTTKVDQYTTALLASTMNTICPAATASNDAGISLVTSPNGFTCGTTFTPVVTVRNFGSSPLTSCTVNYKVDSNPAQTYNWNGNLSTNCSVYTTGCTATVTLPSITVSLGNHTFTAYTSSPNSATDGNSANDQRVESFTAVNSANPPVTEGMETTLPSANCSLLNPDNATTFVKSAPGGFGTSSNSAKIDCYNYAAAGEKDYLVIPPVNLSGATSSNLTFNVAYAPYDATYFEKLDVEASTDCGATWTNVYSKSGSTLGTVAANTNAFTPTASQWRAESVNLSSYVGQPSVMVHLVCTNGYGNNLYIDDINITSVVSVNDIDLNSYVSVFPNPSTGNVFVNISNANAGNVSVKITNAMGEVIVNSNNNTARSMQFDLSKNADGIYFIEVKSGDAQLIKKIFLNK